MIRTPPQHATTTPPGQYIPGKTVNTDKQDKSLQQEIEEFKTTPCGGCGETNPRNRCLGCFHPF